MLKTNIVADEGRHFLVWRLAIQCCVWQTRRVINMFPLINAAQVWLSLLCLLSLITDFAAVFSRFCDFHQRQNKCYYFNDGMDRDKTFPTDLLLLTLVISSGVARIAWHRK